MANLWLQLYGSLPLAQHALFPYLDDRTALRAMRVNRATFYNAYHLYPVRRECRDSHLRREVSSLLAVQQAVAGPVAQETIARCCIAQASSFSLDHLPLPRLCHVSLSAIVEDSSYSQYRQPPLPTLPLLRALRHLTTLELSLSQKPDGDRLVAQMKPGDIVASVVSLSLRSGTWTPLPDQQEQLVRLPQHSLPSSLQRLHVDSLVRLRDCGLPAPLHELIVDSALLAAEPLLDGATWPQHLALLDVCVETPATAQKLFALLPELSALRLAISSPILPGWLPSSLRRLELYGLNHPLLPNALPSSLSELKLEDCALHVHPLVPGSLPSALRSLVVVRRPLGPTSERPVLPVLAPLIVDALPARLTHLTVEGHLPHAFLPGALPAGLMELNLRCCDYNQPLSLDALPRQLRSFISDKYNHPLDADTLPHSIEELHLHSYSHPIRTGCLPSSLRSLVLSDDNFSFWEWTERQATDGLIEVGALPVGLQKLQLSRPMTLLVPGQLPDTLTHLELCGHFFAALPAGWLPSRLVHLVVDCNGQHIDPIRSCTNAEGAVLPASLCSLILDSASSSYVFPSLRAEDLPPNLTHLTVRAQELSCDSLLLSSLTSLELVSKRPLPVGVLREGLVKLTLSHYAHALEPGLLPSSLCRLRIAGRLKAQPALREGVLPNSLRLLELCKRYREVHGSPEQPSWLPRDTELRWIDNS